MFYCITDGAYLSSTREPELTQASPTRIEPPPTIPAPPETLAEIKFHEAHIAAPAKKKRYNWGVWLLMVLVLGGILTVIGTQVIPHMGRPNSKPLPTPSAYYPLDNPAPRQSRQPEPAPVASRRLPLGLSFLQLGTEQYQLFQFTVGSGGGRVVGAFAARGGLANDLLVTIIPASELSAYQSNYPYRSFYESGKVTSGWLDKTLSTGEYYLIIRNPSQWTSRKVRTSLVLEGQ
jgi:hypothetical protein